MTKIYTNLILIIPVLIVLALANAFGKSEPEIELDYVNVNQTSISKNDLGDIVISGSDTITFGYHCDAKRGAETLFLFKIKLRLNDAENIKNTNSVRVAYCNLNQGNYELSIGAFANSWNADPVVVRFSVNDREAALRSELARLRSEIAARDSLGAAGASAMAEPGINISSILIGAGAGIFIILLIFFVNKSISGKKSGKKSGTLFKFKVKGSSMEDMSTITITKEQFDRLTAENSNLRAEVAALRGQIDALQTRGEELISQNMELKDTTDRLMNSQKEFEDLQKQKEDLFAIIIHDLKNPVALVKSLVELLRSYDLTVTEQKEIINDIFETTTRIVALSQEVSRILALESSTLKMNYDYANVNEIVKDVHRRNMIAANNKSIVILLDINERLPKTMLDPQKIDEVIDNLLSNAIKFSHSHGQIRIKSSKSDASLVVEISDNGLGLSEDDVKQAFQRGGKLSALPTAGEPSSGFGLWIVKKLIEAHSGRVWVKSALGKGSTFAFSLPLSESAEEEPGDNN